MCCFAVSQLLMLGKSIISNASKVQDEDGDEDSADIDWPEDSFEKAKIIKTKVQSITGYVEAVSNSFITAVELNLKDLAPQLQCTWPTPSLSISSTDPPQAPSPTLIPTTIPKRKPPKPQTLKLRRRRLLHLHLHHSLPRRRQRGWRLWFSLARNTKIKTENLSSSATVKIKNRND